MLLNSEAGGWISSLLLSFMNTWGFINICTAIEKQFKSGVSVLKNKQQGILFFVFFFKNMFCSTDSLFLNYLVFFSDS